MIHYRRERLPGGTYFFTVALYDRRRSLLTDHLIELRAAWQHTARMRPYKTIAACIFPTTCTPFGNCPKAMPTTPAAGAN